MSDLIARLPFWAKVTGVLFVVLVLVTGGVVIGRADKSKVTAALARTSKAEANLANAQAQVSDLTGKLVAQQGQIDELKRGADAVAAQKQQLDQRAAQLDQQSQTLQQQQGALQQAQAAANANSFGDGLYQVGKDIKAGQYHSAGGSSCYWAELRSSDTSDIITNNISSGPQTVTINSPYFTTSRCGTWTKVG